ncbi:MAG: hypothetical protein D6797_00785 [Bdellovibrio sp.]|nr:MAG: hypothetical protein D6797_00785 [Bdellovibrio sp.]
MPATFQFEGFEPSPELKTFAKEVLWRAENRAPSQSSVRAKLIKTGSGFIAKMKFASPVGHFSAETQKENPKEALNHLYKKIKAKFQDWKKSRVLNFIELQ